MNICERVEKTADKVKQQQKTSAQKVTERLGTNLEKVKTKRDKKQQNLQERRTKRDEQRQEFYIKLENQAQTDEQVEAVAKFKKTVEGAVELRRDTIDAATKETRLANDALMADKKSEVVKVYNEYEANRNKIMSQTNVKCDDTTTEDDLKELAKDTNTQLKQLRTEFREQLKQTRQIGKEAKDLVKERNVVVQEAIQTFKATVDEAREELKLAFGEELDMAEEKATETK
jgi:hypothetical protein